MRERVEVPFPPRPGEQPRGTHVELPLVPMEPRWEYKEVVRDLDSASLLTETELNVLGGESWELAGVASEGRQVHFYFKRERLR